MSDPQPSDPYDLAAFRAGLIENGFIIPTGVRGGDGRTAKFEDVLDRFDALVMRDAEGDGAEALHFPPIVARALIERLGYLGNFPQLIGSIHSFFGDDAAARELAALADAGERWEHLRRRRRCCCRRPATPSIRSSAACCRKAAAW